MPKQTATAAALADTGKFGQDMVQYKSSHIQYDTGSVAVFYDDRETNNIWYSEAINMVYISFLEKNNKLVT